MPQMSPLMWPLIYLTLIHFLSIVNLTLSKTFPSIAFIKKSSVASLSKSWKW